MNDSTDLARAAAAARQDIARPLRAYFTDVVRDRPDRADTRVAALLDHYDTAVQLAQEPGPLPMHATDGRLVIRTVTARGYRDADIGRVSIGDHQHMPPALAHLAAELRRVADEIERGDA